jgi:C-terminal processing protease CtpA/Prc
MLITSVSGNSPAEQAGVLEGELLVGYGESEETLVYDTEFENFEAFLAEKQKEEAFTICLEQSGTRRFIQIAKRSFMENYVFYRSKTTAYRFGGKSALDKESYAGELPALDNATAYIRLTQFNGNAAAQFQKAMSAFQEEGKKNLVLDLRSNGGGYMDILQEIAAYFCKNTDTKKPVVATAKFRDGKKQTFRATGNLYDKYFAEDSKIYLLADDGTASASECLIGAMIDYGACAYEDICLSYRGGVAKTYGKGIMQSTYPFGLIGDVDAIKLTTAKIHWPVSDHCIHGVGVTAENGCKTVEEGFGDGEINAALDLFLNG